MKSIILMILILGEMGRLQGRPVLSESRFAPGSSLLISEILYDPDPSVGLPPYEYVEWYNAGGDTIDLAGWQWVVGDKVRLVAGGRVAPGGYVIVCSPAAAPALRAFGQVIALESFPALRNTGDRLTLLNPAGIMQHSVDYSPDQFTDALKASGGWSLELADPANYCNPLAWLPSVDPSGGTPGKPNSQRIDVGPAEPPSLIRAAGYDDERFVLLFSGTLNPGLEVNNYACVLMPGMIEAPAVPAPVNGFPGLFFHLPDNLDQQLNYTLELNGPMSDCSGQDARLRPVSLGFPSPPDSAGVVISEVLFDPLTDQTEFVEVFNRSAKVIELKDLILARADAGGTLISYSNQQPLSYWLFPACYAVFTGSARSFTKAWPMADPAVAAERPDLPSLTNAESRLILLDRYQHKLDEVIYSPDWHYPYLDNTKGVSLERIDVNVSGTDRANWFSASAASGGCTPGSKNSATQDPVSAGANTFTLNSAVGYTTSSTNPVQIVVSYSFENAGYFMRMNIFSSNGLLIREIFPFGMAPVEGIVSWDGLDEGQRLSPDGIYLIVADFYHPSGKKSRWKKACAIVRAY